MIMEILSTGLNLAGPPVDERYTFTVPGVAGTSVNGNVNAQVPYLRNARRYSSFQANDNVKLVSCGIVFPYYFSLAVDPVIIKFSWKNGVVESPINQIGGQARLILPLDNYEMVTDQFVPFLTIPPVPAGTSWAWVARFDVLPVVSVLNCPAILYAATLPITTWVKVEHNLDMIV